MKLLFNVSIWSLVGVILTMLHVGVLYVFPFPFNKINIVLAATVILIIRLQSPYILFLSFLTFFLLNLYSVQPFGIFITAGVFSTLFIFWIYRDIFTNQSVWVSLSLSILGVVSYRIFVFFAAGVAKIFGQFNGSTLSGGMTFEYIFWEIFLTGILVFIGHLLFLRGLEKKREITAQYKLL